MSEQTKAKPQLDWNELLETALTMPGSVGNEYSRFHNYSWGNVVLLYSQGVEPQPVATYMHWQKLGRQVLRGSKAREIIRPITVKLKDQLDDQGNPKTITRFKPVKCLFPYDETQGDELPPVTIPNWQEDRALNNLDISRMSFSDFNGNVAGYSVERFVAINPMATHPTKTLLHEMAHIVSGHTEADKVGEYEKHRGVFEFEAEAPAYLVSKELEIATPEQDASYRGYLQHWMGRQTPTQESVRRVFTTTTAILNAGRLAIKAEAGGAA